MHSLWLYHGFSCAHGGSSCYQSTKADKNMLQSVDDLKKLMIYEQMTGGNRNAPSLVPLCFCQSGKVTKSFNTRRMGSISRWFHYKDCNNNTLKKKARAENARMHATLSVAGLASAFVAVGAADNSKGPGSKIRVALASATELLASHCIMHQDG